MIILGGQHNPNRIVINEIMFEWYGRMKRCALQILLVNIPTFLLRMLVSFIFLVRHLRNLQKSFRNRGAVERRVYDLGNCGPKNQFMAGNLIAHNCQYGAGVNKIIEILEQDDIVLDYEQVSAIHSGYWEVFAKVKDYGRSLFYEWRRNRGYIVNGMGRPMAIAEGMEKDALNRFVQSTGHDILVRYVKIFTEELDRQNIVWNPIIIDFHDSSCIEVDTEDESVAAGIMQWGVDELNRQLAGSIALRGEPDIGVNLAETKKPEE